MTFRAHVLSFIAANTGEFYGVEIDCPAPNGDTCDVCFWHAEGAQQVYLIISEAGLIQAALERAAAIVESVIDERGDDGMTLPALAIPGDEFAEFVTTHGFEVWELFATGWFGVYGVARIEETTTG